jgi:NAD+ synthase (glutamine-hydrolysing)
MGLAKRLEHVRLPTRSMPVVIGVSGGLDSTLALLVACKTLDEMGVSRDHLLGITMPGFGTTATTKSG